MGDQDPNVWNLVIDMTPGDETGARAIGLALACMYDVLLEIRDLLVAQQDARQKLAERDRFLQHLREPHSR